jgi:hypothetical protein
MRTKTKKVTGKPDVSCTSGSTFKHVATKPINHVEWCCRNGLQAYVQSVFGCHDFTWNDIRNDTYHRFDVSDPKEFNNPDVLGQDLRESYAAAKKKGYIPDYDMRALLLGLIAEGHLPAGDYLVHVSW